MGEAIMKVYTDGACRGNPGPAAIAFIAYANTEIRKSSYIGLSTNNRAEYAAVLSALGYLSGLQGFEEIELFTDSELVVRQLLGEYKVTNVTLLPLYNKVMELTENSILVPTHVPRDHPIIKECDAMCNKTLDEEIARGRV
jgi:ribonuclease HI